MLVILLLLVMVDQAVEVMVDIFPLIQLMELLIQVEQEELEAFVLPLVLHLVVVRQMKVK